LSFIKGKQGNLWRSQCKGVHKFIGSSNTSITSQRCMLKSG